MATLLPDLRKWGIRGAATVVVASLIYQARELVSDESLRIGVIVGALTLLCWILGGFGTEFYKRKVYPDPKTWGNHAVRNDLYLKAAVFGALPCCALLLTYFWPLTPFKGLLLLLYGIAVGGLALPAMRDFTIDILLPIVIRSLRAMKFVIKDNKVMSVPADTPPDLYDKTVVMGEPTVPKDKLKEPPVGD